jgi:2-aminobenzoate-CoA ligase
VTFVSTTTAGFNTYAARDGLIVSAGHKVSLMEVTATLEDHPDVSRARVFSVPDLIRGTVLSAVVTPVERAETFTLSERLHQYLLTQLAPFKCPKEIQILA